MHIKEFNLEDFLPQKSFLAQSLVRLQQLITVNHVFRVIKPEMPVQRSR